MPPFILENKKHSEVVDPGACVGCNGELRFLYAIKGIKNREKVMYGQVLDQFLVYQCVACKDVVIL